MEDLKFTVSGNKALTIDPDTYAHILNLINDYITKQEEGDIEEQENNPEYTSFTFMAPYNTSPSVIRYDRNRETEGVLGVPLISSELNTMHQYVDAYTAIPYDVHEMHAKFIEKVLFDAWDFYNNRFIKSLTNGKELEINTIPTITNKNIPASDPYPRFPEFSAYFFNDMITFAYLMADHASNPDEAKLDSYRNLIMEEYDLTIQNIMIVMESDIIKVFQRSILSEFGLSLDKSDIRLSWDLRYYCTEFKSYVNNSNEFLPYITSDGDTIPKIAFIYGSGIKNIVIQKLRSFLFDRTEITNKEFNDLIFNIHLKIMPTIYDYIQHTLFEIAMHASFTYALLKALGIKDV